MNKNKAFSLIELSIVFVVISILIVGITQSSILLDEYRLFVARSLTINSPVKTMKDLAFWLEPTLQKSFNEEDYQDGDLISTWYDLNPLSYSTINFSQATDSKKPKYKRDAINNLPALYFDGGDSLSVSRAIKLQDIADKDSITIFIVERMDSTGTAGRSNSFLVKSKTGIDRRVNLHFPFDGTVYFDFGVCCTTNSTRLTTTFNNKYVNKDMLVKYRKTASKGILNVNEDALINANMAGTFSDSDINQEVFFSIGATVLGAIETSFFVGHIAEFIVFKRALKSDEIELVEKYLKKKWGLQY
jgi:Tfp pilus assembly protein PilE